MRYIQLIFVALFLSCAKKPPEVAAKKNFVGESNCLEVLKQERIIFHIASPLISLREKGSG